MASITTGTYSLVTGVRAADDLAEGRATAAPPDSSDR
jgi:hypothetical protein